MNSLNINPENEILKQIQDDENETIKLHQET